MRRKNKKIYKREKDTYTIVVDGETEVWYFQMMKRNEPSLQVNIEPKIPQKKKLSEQYKKVLELAEDYTKVFWIIDLDVVISESRIAKRGEPNQIQQLKNYLNELIIKNYDNVITILNNPCLEYWFVLHFEQTTKYFPKCKEAEKQLVNHLKDYKKTKKYFTKQDNDIYLKLKPNLLSAIENSKKTQRTNIEELKRGICEMNLFFETVQIKNILFKKNPTVNKGYITS